MYIERGRVWHTLTERNCGKKNNFQNAELRLISTLILALNIEHFIAVYRVCVPYNGSAGGHNCQCGDPDEESRHESPGEKRKFGDPA